MVMLREISCKHCGGAISLNEEWDKTPGNFRAGDWLTKTCFICGGTITVYKRWIDPPKSHSECMDGSWHEYPCSMCFGPMAVPTEVVFAPKFHPRCVPENWYERTCNVCDKPLRVHVDWDEIPTVHRNCESQQWYEKECKYCDAKLKVHVDWENPPSAHPECGPMETPGFSQPAPEVERLGQAEQPVYTNGYERASELDANGHAYVTGASHGGRVENEFEPEFASSEPDVDKVFGQADDPQSLKMSVPDEVAPGSELMFKPAKEISEIGQRLERIEERPEIQKAFEIVEQTADVEQVSESNYETPVVKETLAAAETAPDLEEISEREEEIRVTGDVPEQARETFENSYPNTYSCSQCGKQLVDLDEIHLGSYGSSYEPSSLCHGCENDAVLVGGAIAALRKDLPFELKIAVETRTCSVAENITVVTNAETGEAIAEVRLSDDGIFRVERTAITYDPRTGEPRSKTVFGHKGFFSSLRTAETFDRHGKLILHARPGKEMALTAGINDAGDHAEQTAKNRFFIRRR